MVNVPTCGICSEEYIPRSPRQKTCGKAACRKAWTTASSKETYKKRVELVKEALEARKQKGV